MKWGQVRPSSGDIRQMPRACPGVVVGVSLSPDVPETTSKSGMVSPAYPLTPQQL